jgi:hypothetical protein
MEMILRRKFFISALLKTGSVIAVCIFISSFRSKNAKTRKMIPIVYYLNLKYGLKNQYYVNCKTVVIDRIVRQQTYLYVNSISRKDKNRHLQLFFLECRNLLDKIVKHFVKQLNNKLGVSLIFFLFRKKMHPVLCCLKERCAFDVCIGHKRFLCFDEDYKT